jgi:Txe/YoeB family toxin of Txe-Axe toxin-antitoxin module
VLTRQTRKDARKLSIFGFRLKAERILEILRKDPYTSSLLYEKLLGALSGVCSRV